MRRLAAPALGPILDEVGAGVEVDRDGVGRLEGDLAIGRLDRAASFATTTCAS